MAARESGLGEESTIEYGERTRDDYQENAARQPPTPKHNHPEAMPQTAKRQEPKSEEAEAGRSDVRGHDGVLDAGGSKTRSLDVIWHQ